MSRLDLPVAAMRDSVARRDVSASEILEESLGRIGARDRELHAFLRVDEEGARRAAVEVDRRVARGEDPGPLAGVPVAVKDNICVRGLPATCGSRILESFVSPYDAHVVERLRAAGAVIVGKTNCDEFAMGSSTENSAFGPTRNPHAPDRAPGGSSGGSAAAVAAGFVPLALGSDTGGSIRQPAALTGTVGLKPTYGRVSRYGLIAFGSSLDQVGPHARNVRDAAALLGVLAGRDARDSTSTPEPVPDYLDGIEDGVRGMRLGLPREYLGEGCDREVRRRVEEAVATYRRLGAEVVPVSLPHTAHGIAVYYVVATAEASSNLARYDGMRYGFRAG
ncbi:MAG: aspartyl/glutamyl-tRNA amidotransferase subunit A, partial [Planctomycetales bacterium]|nr:aspartyl/glutamyl-tRNA amidotransferase subunit A [Planctomycetales bacterium]